MINSFEILINVLEESIICLFLTLYFGSKFKGIKAVGGFLLGTSVGIVLLTYLNSLYVYEAFLGIIFIFLYFAYCVVFLKGDTPTKLFIAGFINCVDYSIVLFVTLVAGIIFGDNVYKIFIPSPERIFLIASTKVLLVAACAVLLNRRFECSVSKNNMALLVLMPIVTQISTVGVMQVFLQHTDLKNELFLAAAGIMLTNFLIYYIFISINKNVKAETELIVLQHKIELDKKNAEEVTELYNKTCGVQHDLLIHFSTISRLIDDTPDKAQEYIKTVMGNQLDEIKTMIKTGNDCFDAIANAKIAVCEKLGIYCQVRVGENSLDTLANDEIAILFGNLFDNAIEASKNSEKKTIQLDVQIQDAYLSVFMKNSIDNSVLDNNQELQTTKQNKEYHGFGIKNIKRIVENHRGMINYDEDDGYFICDILIPR